MFTHTHDLEASNGHSPNNPGAQRCGQQAEEAKLDRGIGVSPCVFNIQLQRGISLLIADGFLAWQERRFVARTTKELLKVYRAVSYVHPDWTRRKLYQLVVMHRTGCNPTVADIILNAAQDSYAQWPSSRELNLCDVAHYLSVTEFLATHPDKRWIQSSLTPIVASHLPHELCNERTTA